MKVTASFVQSKQHLLFNLLVFLWLFGLLLILLGSYLFSDAKRMQTRSTLMLQRIEEADTSLRAADVSIGVPTDNELESLRQRINALNSIDVLRGPSSIKILSWLESNLGDDVYVSSFYHDADKGTVVLTLVAGSDSGITVLLSKIENEAIFFSSTLNKREVSKSGGAYYQQYELHLRLKQ